MSPRTVELPLPDPQIHPVGVCHTGEAGRKQLRLLEYYGLRPDTDLLEIGCGIGRLAYALGPWLDQGSYAGFDIAPPAIDWLNENYAPLLPNFRFDLVDVHNARYRPHTRDKAARAVFPYADDAFDFACSFSVFTHMRMPDIRTYLRELARVLRPGGQGLMTCYVLTEADLGVPLKSFGPFVPIDDGAYSAAPELPERAIGFAHDDFVVAVREAGLDVVHDVRGRWRGPQPDVEGPGHDQDFFVLTPT
jgi:SAM-dependent methyltransferase